MKREYYRNQSLTAEGRYNLHDELLAEINNRMENLIANAPEANREKVRAIFSMAMAKMEKIGNGNLFRFFADDTVSDKDFARAIIDVNKDKIF